MGQTALSAAAGRAAVAGLWSLGQSGQSPFLSRPFELTRHAAIRQIHQWNAAAFTSPASRRWCGCRWTRCAATAAPGSRPARSFPATKARRWAATICNWRDRARLLDEHNIVFRPGVNEDLAATSVMGSQIFEVVGKAKVDGVVGIWYGKGPGVDRSGDIFRHANLAGTGKNCAALVLAGDDHSCKSSTIPHQSDFSLLQRRHSVSVSRQHAGNHRLRTAGDRAVAIFRRVGRIENGHRHLRWRRNGDRRSGSAARFASGELSEETSTRGWFRRSRWRWSTK